MAHQIEIPMAGGVARVVMTDRSDGDFRVDQGDDLARRRLMISGRPWSWLRQVHGAEVVTVEFAGQWSGAEADGAVTLTPGCPLAVTTADCAPVILVADRGVAAVHAGWRGVVGGVIEQATQRLAELGTKPVAALVGPCISPEHYQFGPAELEAVVGATDGSVRATTGSGQPALDLGRAVGVVLEQVGWPPPEIIPQCTSHPGWYSHRTRGDLGRQAAVVWIDEGYDGP